MPPPVAGDAAVPRPRRDQVEWRKEELLHAARRVFAQRGVEAASLKEVAAEAGVAPGLIHHYFGRKDSLVIAVIDRFGFLRDLEALLAAASDRPTRDVLVEIASRFGNLLAEESELMTIFFTGLANSQVRTGLDLHMSTGRTAVAKFLEGKVDAGELRAHDSMAAAKLFLSAIVSGQLAGVPTEPTVLVDLMLDGIAP